MKEQDGEKKILRAHRDRPWVPDILGHQQRKQKIKKAAMVQLEERTKKI